MEGTVANELADTNCVGTWKLVEDPADDGGREDIESEYGLACPTV